MAYIIDGDSNESKGKCKLRKRAAKFIDSIPKTIALEKLNAVSYNSYQDIGVIIGRAQAALLYLSDAICYSKIERKKQDSSITPSILPETEAINKCYFFVSMIGFIDKQIVDCRQSIEHHAKFIDTDEYSAEAYYKAKNFLSKLISNRELILSNLENTHIIKSERSSLPECCFDALEKIPVFEEFSELYKDVDAYNDRNLQLINSFVNAYNTGYNATFDNYDMAINKYTELYSYLQVHIKEKEDKAKAYVKR